MKNILQKFNNQGSVYKVLNYKKEQPKIIDFKLGNNHHFILRVKINNLTNDNYKLVLRDDQLTVILVESRELNRPIHSHNIKLNELINNPFYEEVKSAVFTLPDNNFYLIKHEVAYGGNILKVVLGKMHYN